MKFTLGADPELFMAAANGDLKAACGRIGGTKLNPQPMGIGEGFFVQEDNVAIEFNIPPSKSAKAFSKNLGKALAELADGVQQMHGFQIVNLASAVFPDEELASEAAKEFGCDPDFDAWTGEQNPRPKAGDANLRSCGGHVHVGYDWESKGDNRRTVIKAMDFFLGVPSVLMDKDNRRKQLYGKRGAHRMKPYGVEYRTLSNFWVFTPEHREWVFNSTKKAIDAVELQLVDFDKYDAVILDAINNNNKSVAKKLVKEFKLECV